MGKEHKDETVITYLDIQKIGDRVVETSLESYKEQTEICGKGIIDVVEAVAQNDERIGQEAFKRVMDKLTEHSEESVEKLSTLVGSIVSECYQIGYTEGTSAYVRQNAKALRTLIDRGVINDENGEIERYLKFVSQEHDKKSKQVMGDRALHVYNFNDEENKNAE